VWTRKYSPQEYAYDATPVVFVVVALGVSTSPPALPNHSLTNASVPTSSPQACAEATEQQPVQPNIVPSMSSPASTAHRLRIRPAAE